MNNGYRGMGMAFMVGSAALLAACGGENAFTEPATENQDPPVITEFTTSESVSPNSILTVRVEGTSSAGVRRLDIDLSRGVVRDTTRLFDPPREDFGATTQFTMPSRLDENTVLVRVTLRDRLGAESDAEELVVPVVDDPGFSP